MKKILFSLLFIFISLALDICIAESNEAGKMTDTPVSPEEAVISPSGAYLTVKQKALVFRVDGMSCIACILPEGSEGFQISVPDHTIVSWNSNPVLFEISGAQKENLGRLQNEKDALSAELTAIKARLNLWQAIPGTASAEDVLKLQAAMGRDIPDLALEQLRLQNRLQLLESALKDAPGPLQPGIKIRVILKEDEPAGTQIEIAYQYLNHKCGWEPSYVFNALPGNDNDDAIETRLMAKIWQKTGIDWDDTKITLSTEASASLMPQPLPEWIVDSRRIAPVPYASLLKGVAPAMLNQEQATDSAPVQRYGDVTVNTGNMIASWTLSAHHLPQGESHLQILQDRWQAPLQWLARPTWQNNRVWLFAECQLPKEQVWPAARAIFNLNGQNIGEGQFSSQGNEATLYFGADPRVSIKTTELSHTRGKKGFISANKTWTWDWIYTLYNQHPVPIEVKVERPAPIIVDEGVTVSNANKPEAKIDESTHMYEWKIPVPAHGDAEIRHSLTISSPNKLPLLPDAP